MWEQPSREGAALPRGDLGAWWAAVVHTTYDPDSSLTQLYSYRSLLVLLVCIDWFVGFVSLFYTSQVGCVRLCQLHVGPVSSPSQGWSQKWLILSVEYS